MRSIKKSGTNILTMVVGLVGLTALAIWQFYSFATFRNLQGIGDAQGGAIHFWWGLAAAVVACFIGYLLFSVFLRYDKDNELHITS